MERLAGSERRIPEARATRPIMPTFASSSLEREPEHSILAVIFRNLYFRLNVIGRHPPLRDPVRGLDVLAKHLIASTGGRAAKRWASRTAAITRLVVITVPGTCLELREQDPARTLRRAQ